MALCSQRVFTMHHIEDFAVVKKCTKNIILHTSVKLFRLKPNCKSEVHDLSLYCIRQYCAIKNFAKDWDKRYISIIVTFCHSYQFIFWISRIELVINSQVWYHKQSLQYNMYRVPEKSGPKCFCHNLLQSSANSDTIWYTISWINLQQRTVNTFST